MRQTVSLAALVLLAGSAAFAADPELMNLVMPDAKIVAGVNATNARISPLGQFLIAKAAMQNGGPREALTAVGFDPLTDVSEILAASSADSAHPAGLIAAKGTFNVDKITAAAAGNHGSTSQTYGGAKLVIWAGRGSNPSHAVAFLGSNIALAGDVASVEGALDRRNAVNSIDPALATQVNQLSSTEDEWIASSLPFASLLNGYASAHVGQSEVMPELAKVQSFTAGVKFGSDVQIAAHIVGTSPENAAAMASVVRMGVTFASMNSGKSAEISGLLQALQTMTVNTSGTSVDVALTIPEAQAESLFNQMWKPEPTTTAGQLDRHHWRRAENGN